MASIRASKLFFIRFSLHFVMQILPHPFRSGRETAGFTFFFGDASGVTPVCYGIKTMSFIIRDARPKGNRFVKLSFRLHGRFTILSQSGGLTPPPPKSAKHQVHARAGVFAQ
ncbi:MAG: hypothetical protein ACLVB5_01755 [Christensenellales bacterium]